MEVQPIRDAHNQKPFKPFTITTAAGEKFDVTHPENMWQTGGGRTVLLRKGPEGVAMIDADSITSLEFGKARRRSGKDT